MADGRAVLRPLGLLLVLLAAAVGLLQSPAGAQTPPTQPPCKWAVFAYIDGDNNLEDYAVRDIDHMEAAIRVLDPAFPEINDTTVRVFVLFDRLTDNAHFFELLWDDPAQAQLDNVISDSVPDTATDMGEVDMASPSTLASFIRQANAMVSRDNPRKALVLWDHGEGWRAVGSTPPPTKMLLEDETNQSVMTQDDLQAALQMGGVKFDTIYIDACQMGFTEVAYGLRHYCDTLVFSQETVHAVGGPYDSIVSWLYANADAGGEPFAAYIARAYVSSLRNGTQDDLVPPSPVIFPATASAVRMSALPRVATALSAFSNQLIADFYADPSGQLPVYIHTWWELSQLFTVVDAYTGLPAEWAIDLESFAYHAAWRGPTDALRARAWDLVSALEEADLTGDINREFTVYGYPWGVHHGLSIYYPCQNAPEAAYLYTALAMDTTWDDFIRIAPIGPDTGFVQDAYERDGSPEGATDVGYFAWPGYQGRHWFDFPDDTDVFSFYGDANWTSDDWVGEREQVFAIYPANTGPLFSPRVFLLDQDGVIILQGDQDLIKWRCPKSGTYYIAVTQNDSGPYPWAYGGRTYYDLVCDIVAYTDVRLDSWAAHATSALFTADIATGIGGQYMPYLPVTRDQMAAYIARSLSLGDANVPNPAPGIQSFPDIGPSHWAYTYVEYCKDLGIVAGYPEGGYRPDEVVNRGQMAAFIARALAGGEAGVPEVEPYWGFGDVRHGDWAYKYVVYCRNKGIVGGYGGDEYRPELPVNREQMAVFVYRAFLQPRNAMVPSAMQ